MANMFEKYAADREAEQKKIEKAVVADTTADEKRTTLSLSLTVSDKKALKMMAAERETTIGRDYPRVGAGASEGGERVVAKKEVKTDLWVAAQLDD